MHTPKFVAALLLSVSVPSVSLAGYGMDVVPGSSFQQGTWQFYGTDQVPHSALHAAGLLTAYGSDRIPGTLRELPEQHPHHVLITETIQHLTGAVEVTPGSAKKPAPRRLRGDENCLPRR